MNKKEDNYLYEKHTAMKKKKITATFIGRNGSCGYKTGERYTLIVTHNPNTYINIVRVCGCCGYNDYESIVAFFNNWDEITTHKGT